VAKLDVVRRGPERLRIGSWRGDDRIAYMAPVAEASPTATMVRLGCALLAERGYGEALTSALSPVEQQGFLRAGFSVCARLDLLSHDLVELPDPPGIALRRGRRTDRGPALAVDAVAFPAFWQLDAEGLDEALAATPSSRFRVAADPEVLGYAVTGRAGPRGYLQRLAVHPAAQGRGIGRALVLDGLRWLKRKGAERVVVNTQDGNWRARALYESLGFRVQPTGLAVLSRRLEP
jgi:ribosomal protein S18 acetylase RimI-like enzyme